MAALNLADHLRAQRLSASWIGSPGQSHGFSTSAKVLNACRRHGSVHLGVVLVFDESLWCSTPVGVMDRFTKYNADIQRHNNVLNACRRHGSVHVDRLLGELTLRYVLN